MSKNTAILLLTYRKHEFLKEILNEISIYQPSKLYIFQNKEKDEGELEMIQKVKSEIYNFENKFEIEYKEHQTHLPISKSYYAAMDYVFSKEDQIIVLEDDVIPNISFFHFCNFMLEKYKNSSEIGCINGCNLNAVNLPNSYFYSYLSLPYWGWATWKSKWEINRSDNHNWNQHRNEILNKIKNKNKEYFTSVFDGNSNGVNVWDLQWNLSLIANNLKTIISGANLTSNKGFMSSAITTIHSQSKFKNLKVHSFSQNLIKLESNNKSISLYHMKIIELFK